MKGYSDESTQSKDANSRPLVIRIAFAIMFVAGIFGVIFYIFSSSNINPNNQPLDASKYSGEENFSEFNATSAVQECLKLQFGRNETNPEATDCFRESLYLAVKFDQFDQVFALQTQINASGAYGPCHSGAHLAGVDLVQDSPMHEILPILFKTVVPGKDIVCTTGLVHGLVQGSALGDPPFDLPYLAEQCILVQDLKSDYATECAHYFGHVAYKNYNSLDEKVAKACELLQEKDRAGMVASCVGGALMQKTSLQDDTYNPTAMDTEIVSLNPPLYEESINMCSQYNSYPNKAILESCWNGIGWLLAMRSSRNITDLQNPSSETVTNEYIKGVNYCLFDECTYTYLLHLRPEDHDSQAVKDLCVSNKVTVNTSAASFNDMCEFIVASLTGGEVSEDNELYDGVYG